MMNRNVIKLVLFIALFNSLNAKSQIIGDWFLSHSYSYGLELDMSYKYLEKPSISVFTSDSIFSYLISENELQKSIVDYLYYTDSIILSPNNRDRFLLQSILNADTLFLADHYVKGGCVVFRRIDKVKKTITIEDVKKYFNKNVFQVDFAKFPLHNDSYLNQPSNVGIVMFSSNNDIIVNSGKGGNWKLYLINGETYLLIDQFLFQVVKINRNKFILNSYYFDSKKTLEWKVSKIKR